MMKITIIWHNELFNGKGLKAKHMIFVGLFHSKGQQIRKNVDAKRVIGSHKSKKGRQCNGQTKKDKLINNGLQNNYTEN
jgi:hypothetical protein